MGVSPMHLVNQKRMGETPMPRKDDMTFVRVIRILLATATALVVLWAFGFVGYRFVRSHFGPRRPITLTVLHWGDNAENAILEKLCKRYEDLHPDIHIENISVADYDPKLKTMFAAGTPPDVFYLAAEKLTEMASLGVVVPLDEYVERERKSGTGQWLDDFYPILLDAFRYDGQHVGRGPIYGLPKDFTTVVMYVNVDLFNKAGVKVPYDGWTWQEYEETCRKITALSKTEGRNIYGGVIESWPGVLRNTLWSYGGEYFSDDFQNTLLDTPESQNALKMIRRLRFDDRIVFNATSGNKEQGGQEFFSGNIGVHGPIGCWKTPRYRSIPAKTGPNDPDPAHFTWDVVPVPRGTKQASAIFTVAWSMSTSTKHREQSFDLIKFMCGPDGNAMNARLGLALPSLQSVAKTDAFLGGLPRHSQVFLDAIEYAKLGQFPKQPEAFRIIEKETTSCLQQGVGTTEQCAQSIQQQWRAQLSSPLKTRDYPRMPWGRIVLITLLLVLTATALVYWHARREKIGALDRRAERAGWLFISPWLIGFVVLTLGPMIVSALLSLTRWTAMTPFTHAEFVGTHNYQHLFRSDPSFYHSLWVTIYFVAVAVPLSQAAALGIALLMNSRIRTIALFRTIYFVPSVVSGVALATLWLWIFNANIGPLNKLLAPIARVFGTTPPDWIGTDATRWGVPAFVLMGLWGVGGGMIIYLAGLKGIPVSLYEAATIDGAGKVRQFWNITLPMLSPLLFYQLVMGIIGSFQVFTQAKVMLPDGGPGNFALFYVFNLYRQAFEFHEMGYASAMAWILFLLLLGLTILIFRASKNLVYYEGLRT